MMRVGVFIEQMSSGKKANTWHFGMKVHIAVCTKSGIVYSAKGGPANEHDITRLHDVLADDELKVFLDSGNTGCEKRPEILDMNLKQVEWYVAAKPNKWKKLASPGELETGAIKESITQYLESARTFERAKAAVRCKVERAFLWLKRIYGYAKTRCRGIDKNLTRVLTLFSLYNWYRIWRWRQMQEASS